MSKNDGGPAFGQWLPIESAPDGELILVHVPGHDSVIAHMVANRWTVYVPRTPMLFQPALALAPTHWMPLPPPPAKDQP